MDKGTKLYQDLIDELVKMSRECVDANNVKKGSVPYADSGEINAVLQKLSDKDREIVSEFILGVYSSAIFDVLDLLEWYTSCGKMKISIEGETLPTDKFEGMQNDFIGRRDGWEWTE